MAPVTCQSTLQKDRRDRLRFLVASLLDAGTLKWRRHGIGCLQAYVHEGEAYEQRIHIWSPELMLPGIDESGNAHNHRFTLTSTVLLGALRHTEMVLEPDPFGCHETFDFVHARLHTDDNRADMRATGERFAIKRHVYEFGQLPYGGCARYTFPRGAFHSSEPLTGVVVTLVEKTDQVEEKAMVVAPVDRPPVPAFGGDPVPRSLQHELIQTAIAGLRA